MIMRVFLYKCIPTSDPKHNWGFIASPPLLVVAVKNDFVQIAVAVTILCAPFVYSDSGT